MGSDEELNNSYGINSESEQHMNGATPLNTAAEEYATLSRKSFTKSSNRKLSWSFSIGKMKSSSFLIWTMPMYVVSPMPSLMHQLNVPSKKDPFNCPYQNASLIALKSMGIWHTKSGKK